MVRTFLKVYMELGSSFLFLQKQIKDIIIIGEVGAVASGRRRWASSGRGPLQQACGFTGV